MAENSLLGKLDGLVSRFEEVGTLITDPAVIAYARRFLICTSLFYWLLSPLNTIRYSIQGIGFSTFAVLKVFSAKRVCMT